MGTTDAMAQTDPTRQPWEVRQAGQEAAEQTISPTSPPIREEERGRLDPESDRRDTDAPSPTPRRFLVLTGISAAIVIALGLFAGATGGWGYFLPFLIILALLLSFVGFHRWLGVRKSTKYGGQVVDGVAEDASDPVPHVGFDEGSELGEGPQYADEDAHHHGDMKGPAGGAGGPA
ncbi:MAG TPA: hypothetical protein VGN78_16835 [Solirubrobacteraceae bacterium]|jgi:hypothetical protein|nr:hypothetical protein [Solirubrobacteraceae bacterium]